MESDVYILQVSRAAMFMCTRQAASLLCSQKQQPYKQKMPADIKQHIGNLVVHVGFFSPYTHTLHWMARALDNKTA
jgi:hypothetical protein